MPTETVYGLACLATDPEAVEKVFAAKGRPPESPLIVHVSGIEQARQVAELDERAVSLILEFWPGPLTLVLPKTPGIPSRVTAGLPTVAVRMPSHPVAQELISRAGPLAAPSANRFSRLSPTRAEDVDPDLGDFLVLDGGPCDIGLESTVLDLTGAPRVLRPGQVSAADLEAVLEQPVSVRAMAVDPGESHSSPGLHLRHYSPRTPVRLVPKLGTTDAGLTFAPAQNDSQVQMPRNPSLYAAQLYAVLADLDRRDLTQILIEEPPRDPEWAAIWDRLQRAAHR